MLDLNSNWTMGQCVLHWAKTTPDAVAVKSHGESLTYKELAELAARHAQALQSVGVKSGMIVGINVQHNIVALLLAIAVQAVGAAPMSVSNADLADSTTATRCTLLFVEETHQLPEDCKHVITVDQSLLSAVAAQTDVDVNILTRAMPPGEAAIIFTSSGTTSERKHIPISQAALRSRYHERLQGNVIPYNLRIVICCFHVLSPVGATWGAAALFVGGCIWWAGIEDLAINLPRESVRTAMIVVSPFVAANLVQSRKEIAYGPFVRLLYLTGAEPSRELAENIVKYCAQEIQVNYGSTELSGIAVGAPGQPKTIRPDVNVRIVDQTGVEVPLGSAGFIEAQSVRASSGYLWNPGLTQKHFVNGWFRTFDVGYMPAPGKLVVLGRGDDVLNIGGVKIAPQPIEDKIKVLNGVSDAVLLALPSPIGIESLHVVIERADKNLDQALATQIQPLMPPGAFQCHFLDKMPRTETGKIQRNVLRDLLLRHMQAVAPTRH